MAGKTNPNTTTGNTPSNTSRSSTSGGNKWQKVKKKGRKGKGKKNKNYGYLREGDKRFSCSFDSSSFSLLFLLHRSSLPRSPRSPTIFSLNVFFKATRHGGEEATPLPRPPTSLLLFFHHRDSAHRQRERKRARGV